MKSQPLKAHATLRRRVAESENPPSPPTPAQDTPPTVRSAKARTKVKPTHPAAPGKFQELRPVTKVEANLDVGYGNQLFIRGQGDGLSWEKGLPLTCVEASRWVWTSEHARGQVMFKLLLNDERWAQGGDVQVEAGQSIEVVPVFA